MKKTLLLIFSFFLYFQLNVFATGLNAGDIMIVGFNVDDDDNLAFMTFVNIPNNTTIYFTDNEWNGSAIGSGGDWNDTNEGFFSWTNDTGGDILAGSVVILDNLDGTPAPSTACGDVADGSGSFNMGGTDEVVYVFCGSNETTPTTFLTALGNDGFTVGTLTGTGLTAGVNATAINGDEDIGVFNGPITGSTTPADIANPSNWTTQDGSGSQSSDSTVPDWPVDVPSGTADCNLALPISLTAFKANVIENEQSIQLNWRTASEENNEYFSIERSQDGVNFSEIGIAAGAGTTNEVNSYSFIDREAATGLNYYRLMQVDFDGKFSYSNVVTAELRGEDNSVFVSPNPTENVIFIQPNKALEKNTNFDIINMQGQVVLSSILLKGESNLELNISDFPTGIYYLRLFVDHQVVTKKILKQ